VDAVVEDDGDSARERGADKVVGASDMLREVISMARNAWNEVRMREVDKIDKIDK
jgi:hypothetical protein